MKVTKGVHTRPRSKAVLVRGLDDHVWALMLSCWIMEPLDRPRMSEVIESLMRISASAGPRKYLEEPTAPPISGDGESRELDEDPYFARYEDTLHMLTVSPAPQDFHGKKRRKSINIPSLQRPRITRRVVR